MKTLEEKINELVSSRKEFYEEVQKMRELADNGKIVSDGITDTHNDDVTMNIIGKYLDKMVSPYITSPVTIDINNNTDEGKVVKAFVEQVEVDSCATQAYLSAIQGSMSAGIGFVHVGITYNSDDNLESSITIDSVDDPTMCYINGDALDGSDATMGVYFKLIDKEVAESKWGEGIGASPFSGFSLGNKNSVVSAIVYEKDVKRKKRQWKNKLEFEDFDENLQGIDNPIATRLIEIPQIKMTHYVGDKVVTTAKISIPYIPIIPFYGKKRYIKNEPTTYIGIANILKDIQLQLNEYNRSESILVSTTPINTWMGREDVIAGGITSNTPNFWNNEKVRRRGNTIATYKATNTNGAPIEPPRLLDNTINNGSHIQGKQALLVLAEELIGQLESYSDSPNESGIALMIKSMESSKTTAPYVFNMNESIKQIGRVVIWLMNEYYDYPRTIKIDGEDLDIVFTDLQIDPRTFKTEVISGPAVESNRMITIKSLMDIMMIYQDSVPALSKELIKLISLQNKDEILKALDKILPPELREQIENEEDQIDPEAKAVIDQMEQVIQEQQAMYEEEINHWRNMSNYFYQMHLSKTADNQIKLDTQEMKSVENIVKEVIKQQTQLAKEGIPFQPISIDDALSSVMEAGQESQTRINERDEIPELTFNREQGIDEQQLLEDDGSGYSMNRQDVMDSGNEFETDEPLDELVF